MKLFLVVNVDWFFLSHRLPIALEAKKRGYNVTVVSIDTGRAAEIRSHGLDFIPLPTNRRGMNVLKEIPIVFLLYNIYKKYKPDIVHHVALKPVMYGSLAARVFPKIRFVNAISGMGYIFSNSENDTGLRKLVKGIFKIAFNNKRLHFIFQNDDDKNLILNLNVVKPAQCHIIQGSGIDLNEFMFTPAPNGEVIKILYTGRLLWDKGIGELIEAAQVLKKKFGETIQIILAGSIDEENRAFISEQQILDWQQKGIISWMGFQSDVYKILADAQIVVLPSYREGLPKSLIEACAVGRPIVTTGVPGCRDVVENGINGLLVPAKNSVALAEALETLIINKELRETMGRKGREIAEQKFSIESVLQKTFAIYEGSND